MEIQQGVGDPTAGDLTEFSNLLSNWDGSATSKIGVYPTTPSWNDGQEFIDKWYHLCQTAASFGYVVGRSVAVFPYIRLQQAQAAAQRVGLIQWVKTADCVRIRQNYVVASMRARASPAFNLRFAILEWTGLEDHAPIDVVNDWTSTTYTPGNFFISGNLNVLAVSGPIAASSVNAEPAIVGITGALTSNNLAVFIWSDAALAQNSFFDLEGIVLEPGNRPRARKTRPINVERLLVDGLQPPWRNRIINGEFKIDQRINYGTKTINAAGMNYGPDRWAGWGVPAAGVFGLRALYDATGYYYCFANVTTPDASIAASDNYLIIQNIEGLNIYDLLWGTANAKPVTLSFEVFTTAPGTFPVAIRNSVPDRSWIGSFSTVGGNVWERKTIVIPGDTTGTWGAGTGVGINLLFVLACGNNGALGWQAGNFLSFAGATNFMANNGHNFALRNVQLEAGPVATPFERVPYDVEFGRCLRYYERLGAGMHGYAAATTVVRSGFFYKANKRVTPTLSGLTTTPGTLGFGLGYVSAVGATYAFGAVAGNTDKGGIADVSGFTGMTLNLPGVFNINDMIQADAEL